MYASKTLKYELSLCYIILEGYSLIFQMQVLHILLLYIYLKFLFRLNYSVLMGYYL